jgi:hypothetical protein
MNNADKREKKAIKQIRYNNEYDPLLLNKFIPIGDEKDKRKRKTKKTKEPNLHSL